MRRALASTRSEAMTRRAAAERGAATAERADRLRHAVRVAMQHHDLVPRHAELIGDDLREHGLVALTVSARAGNRRDLAAGFDAHDATLEPGAGARLDERRQSDADHLAFCPRAIAFGDQGRPVGQLERTVERARVLARVVHGAERVACAGSRRGGTKFCRRIATGSRSRSRAAASTTRSINSTDSGRPAPR